MLVALRSETVMVNSPSGNPRPHCPVPEARITVRSVVGMRLREGRLIAIEKGRMG